MALRTRSLFYSVSDPELYEKLRSTLPDKFPDRTFAFPGDTFADHPNWLPGQKATLKPTTRLLWKWALMDDATQRKIAPALQNPYYDVVIILNFGLDVYRYALRHADCKETLEFHKLLVSARVLQQGIDPPVYFTGEYTCARARRIDDDYFKDPRQTRIEFLSKDHDHQVQEIAETVNAALRKHATRRSA